MAAHMLKCFDYIVVGGGTSGLAGYDHLEDPQVAVPALWPNLIGSDLDWQFWTAPQEGFAGRSVKLPAGKLLGGSSGLNGQALIGASKAGIDAWAKLGYAAWSWESLQPYYKRFHTLHVPDQKTKDHLGMNWIDPQVSGTSGPIQACFAGAVEDQVSKAWVDTFKSLGFATTADPFSGQSIGGYSNAYGCDPTSKTRSYSTSAYYAPAMSRPNLTVMTGAYATQILFDHGSVPARATGVSYMYNGSLHTTLAKAEVILAAGALQTPKLLELSGIGDSKLLAKHGIDVIIDNPHVGENLQDHVMTGISMEAADGVPTGDSLLRQEPAAVQEAMDMYTTHKAGPLAAGGVASHAFMPMPNIDGRIGSQTQKKILDDAVSADPRGKDYAFHSAVREVLEDPTESSAALFLFAVQVDCHSVTSRFVDPTALKPGSFITLGANQCHPFSRGNTHVASSDPLSKPAVDPKYLSHPADIEILARHFQFLETLAKTGPLANLIKSGGMRNHPSAYTSDSNAAKAYLRHAGMSNWHLCGSCAMMPQEKGGVVGPTLLVHGASNVRVVDASVFPLIPRGNNMSTVYATAERAADIIRANTALH